MVVVYKLWFIHWSIAEKSNWQNWMICLSKLKQFCPSAPPTFCVFSYALWTLCYIKYIKAFLAREGKMQEWCSNLFTVERLDYMWPTESSLEAVHTQWQALRPDINVALLFGQQLSRISMGYHSFCVVLFLFFSPAFLYLTSDNVFSLWDWPLIKTGIHMQKRVYLIVTVSFLE